MPKQNQGGSLPDISPVSLLLHSATSYEQAHLQVHFQEVCWSLYLKQGEIIYASHSIAPMERLDRHLNYLKHQVVLPEEIDRQLQVSFEIDLDSQDSDYQAICYLVNHQLLKPTQAAILLSGMVKEVMESFLWLRQGTYEIKEELAPIPEICRFPLHSLVEHCQKRLQEWQVLSPQISSPYQRPFIRNRSSSGQIEQKMISFLKGKSSFYHLAILMRQSELRLAQSLHPYILDGSISLHEPYSPFDQLPLVPAPTEILSLSQHLGITAATQTANYLDKPLSNTSKNNKYNILCVDDSPIALQEISGFLDSDFFAFFPVSDSLKALFQILRIKPDLILLKLKMSKMNGYEVCQLIRNHPRIKQTPVIFMADTLGILDWTKAMFLGASGYLCQPFSQTELLKVLFKNLP